MSKTFDFPYTMMGSTCPSCGAARESIDGRSLRAARSACGVSLRELARRIGLSAAYLSDVERNKRNVTRMLLGLYRRWRV